MLRLEACGRAVRAGALAEAQRALLKPVFERLIARSLPDLVRKLKLVTGT